MIRKGIGIHFPDEASEMEFTSYGYLVKVHKDLDLVASVWDRLAASNIFLSSDFLNALQAAPPEHMQFRYLTVWNGDALAGVMYVQLSKFKGKRSISYHRDDVSVQKKKHGFPTRLRNLFASRVEFTTLICGNGLITGAHGFRFIESISEQDQWRIVDDALHQLVRLLRDEGIRVRLLFIKDFVAPSVKRLHLKEDSRVYHGFHAQPNMIMDIPQEWNSFDDYLNALSSKYRLRARRAFKKCKGVKRRELELEDLEFYRDKITEYYRDIADNASFNLLLLNPDYFISIKKNLGDRFRAYGYFDGDQLIAFCSMMINGDEIEAHFLGYEEDVNKEKQLYMNMLLNMISMSINLGMRRIIYGRTAMEIKSSVGAEPMFMQFYLQYQNAFINACVPLIYRTLEPEVKWKQRNPFREE